jgi:acetylornithine deacetylase/succinyl-diaminopimelate desuccinylase-like protein
MIGIAHHHRLQAVLLGAFLPAAVAVGELRAQQKASDFLHEISVPEEEAIARRVLASPAVARAMEYIRGAEAETVREWLQLCNAYGPSGDEIYRANLLHKLMRMYGLENVHIDDQRNVIGIRRGTGGGPKVIFFAHHDVSAHWPKEQPVEAFVADGRIWCPGAGDNLMGVTQLLTILRALNAGDVKHKGDIWFTFLTGEEPLYDVASRGAELLVLSNYPHNFDWRKGDIMMQIHGGGGGGVSTGSVQVRHRTQLRVFVPVDWNEWGRHAVDALGPIIIRVSQELRDDRSTTGARQEPGAPRDLLFLNMAMVHAGNTLNQVVTEASIRFNLHATSEAQLWRVHEHIQRIAAEECAKLGCTWHYSINSKNGAENPIPEVDKVNHPAARMAVAASNVLYGNRGIVDSGSGCGDCVRAWVTGMPAFSLRGRVLDRNNGTFELDPPPDRLSSDVRLKTRNHDPTTSAEIVRIWAGVRHGLLFAVAYAGLDDTQAAEE